MAPLDHLTVVAPSLALGIETFAGMTGVSATPGGRHSINGTANALIGLGGERYLEIMCPDPDGPPGGTLGERIGTLPAPLFVNYLVRSRDIGALAKRAEGAGLRIDPDFTMSRRTPAGDTLTWRIGVVAGHEFGPVVPHFIDWMDSPHPGTRCVQGCALKSIRALTHDVDGLRRLHEALGIGVGVHRAESHALEAVLDTPKGEVRLRTGEHLTA